MLRTLGRRLDADREVRDGQRLLAVRRADAVRAGIAATENNDVLALRGQLVDDHIAGTDAVLLYEVLHGEMHPGEVPAGNGEVARLERARRHHHGVVTRPQLVPGDVHPDVHARAEPCSLGLHLLEPGLEMLLLHLEVRDPVAQEAADAVVPLEDGDRVAGAGELLRRREPGRAGAHDRDGLTGEALRRMRLDPVVREGLIDDRHLDLLDRDGRLVDGEHAGALTGRGAQPPGEFREVVRGMKPLDRLATLAAPHEVVPLRDEVAERAAVMTERDAAVHAAPGLLARRGRVPLLVDLFPVHEPKRDRATCRKLPLSSLQESLGISHRSPPRF